MGSGGESTYIYNIIISYSLSLIIINQIPSISRFS